MIDLGKNIKDSLEASYPSMGKREGKKVYRSVSVPYEILGGKDCKIGDKISIEISGVVTGICQNEYSSDLTIEAREGEVESEAQEKKETLLGGE